MDPNSLNNLDPKLKETYDRVMGTTTTTPPAAPTAAPTAPPPPIDAPAAAPVTAAPPAPAMNVAPAAPVEPPAPPPAPMQDQNAPVAGATAAPYTQDNLSFQAAIQQAPIANPALPGVQPAAGVAPAAPPSSLLRILYIIGAVVFFVVYTIVWVKIFNLPLPF
jgi:hypothetical protein